MDSKKIVASVITYKQLYQANTQWYFDNVISPNVINKDVDLKMFDIRPQIISIMELEQIMLHFMMTGENIFKLFEEKVNKGDFLAGDWISYLKYDNGNISLLNEVFKQFMKEFLHKVFYKDVELN